MQDASARVAEIIEAAERAADQILDQAEERLRARIAEADRAADNRVQAAEAEALEVLANAQEQAEKLIADAHQQAADAREEARREAREIVGEASAASRDVLRDGTELSGNLRDLSDSLRSNAELLMRDIRLAHAEMTARLDQGAPASTRSAERSRPPGIDDLDVPEFHPGR
jgi:vacuolar-type H+-ATPase subunit H